jgi:hypothetical protein
MHVDVVSSSPLIYMGDTILLFFLLLNLIHVCLKSVYLSFYITSKIFMRCTKT